MINRRNALIAIVLSALLITAAPAATANTDGQLVTGSSHTTDSDFGNAEVMENFEIIGTGENAAVGFRQTESTAPTELENSSEFGTWSGRMGVTISPNTYVESVTAHPRQTYAEWDTVELIRVSDGSAIAANDISGKDTYSTEDFTFDTPLSPDEDYYVTVEGDYNGDTRTQYTDDSNLPRTSSNGDIIGGANGLSTSTSRVWVFESVDFKASGAPSGEYLSASHTVNNAEQASVTVSEISNYSTSSISAEYWTGTTWESAGSTSFSSPGEYTIDLSGEGDTWRIRAMVDGRTDPHAEFRMDSESIQFTNQAPSVDNASASPSGGELITDPTPELSIDVDDSQFGSTQGESVDVTFYNASDDSQIGTDTLNSAGTASTEWDSVTSGDNEWYVIAEDDYGGTVQSATFNFTPPETLYIYDESSPDSLVNSADVEIQFYFEGESEQIITRSTSDGTVDMSGLDPDTPFIVVAEADGYHPRRIFVESLYDEQEIFLLPESEEYVDLTFEFEDFSGRFSEETTVMMIERELNGEWRTVQGDFFGGTGQYTTQLEHNTRHRLSLLNTETGATRSLGTLTPTTSGIQTIEVTSGGDIELEGMEPTISVSPATRSLAAIDGASVGIDVSAGNKQIDEWSATVASGSDVFHSETVTSGPGSISPTFNLSEYEGESVTVDVEIVLDDGTTITDSVTYGVREHYDHQYSLLSTLVDFKGILPGEGATTFLAVVCTVLITGAVGGYMQPSSEVLGGVAVASIAFFSIIGWVGYSLLFAGSVTWMAAFALRRGI